MTMTGMLVAAVTTSHSGLPLLSHARDGLDQRALRGCEAERGQLDRLGSGAAVRAPELLLLAQADPPELGMTALYE